MSELTGAPCTNAACRCTHTHPCDRGWVDAQPTVHHERQASLPPNRLPLTNDRHGQWRDKQGGKIETVRATVDEDGQPLVIEYDRVRRCEVCKRYQGTTETD